MTWTAGGVAAFLLVASLFILAQPTPSGSDAIPFAMFGAGLLFAYAAAALAFPTRWWTWWIPAAWLGLDVAALFLAYKDTFALELAYFGPIEFGVQVLIHVLIAPIEVFFGFVVGFVEPNAWIVVLLCVTLAILAAELIRRRLWPRSQREAAASPAKTP